ncbi:MAG TPA: hypothetical protein VG797_04935 [Phycisphaerales bacterium]|nr:hypothetical protein [Phycisphaerales bacterium]
MKWITAALAFIVVFACCFVLGGWFLMPLLPPVPTHPVSAMELEFWIDNWAGALLGLVLGALSARSTLRRHVRRAKD